MTDRYPGALLVSLTLHGAVAGLMFLLAFANQSHSETAQVFELVAGEGDGFMETKAPALGEPGAPKLDLPKPLPETPKPKEIAPPEPAPVTPAPPPVAEKPIPKAPEEKPLPAPIDYAKAGEKKMARTEAKTKATLAKQHEAEAKKAATLTKEQFDKKNPQKIASAAPVGAPPKVAKLDSQGIRKGVEAGSTDNKTGGAGGKALVRDQGPVMDAYLAYLKQQLGKALDKPPGLSDSLETTVEFFVNADGSLTATKIIKSSGSGEFDSAVMAAVASVAASHLPARPDKKSDKMSLTFKMKEEN